MPLGKCKVPLKSYFLENNDNAYASYLPICSPLHSLLFSALLSVAGNYISQAPFSLSLKRGLANEQHWQKTRGQEEGGQGISPVFLLWAAPLAATESLPWLQFSLNRPIMVPGSARWFYLFPLSLQFRGGGSFLLLLISELFLCPSLLTPNLFHYLYNQFPVLSKQ